MTNASLPSVSLPGPRSRRSPSSSGRVKADSKSHREATAKAGLYSVRAGWNDQGSGPGERPAESGELCTCGRQASVVFIGGRFGNTGWCGLSDGGAKGPCRFCGGAGHTGRCPRYQLRLSPDDEVSR